MNGLLGKQPSVAAWQGGSCDPVQVGVEGSRGRGVCFYSRGESIVNSSNL